MDYKSFEPDLIDWEDTHAMWTNDDPPLRWAARASCADPRVHVIVFANADEGTSGYVVTTREPTLDTLRDRYAGGDYVGTLAEVPVRHLITARLLTAVIAIT